MRLSLPGSARTAARMWWSAGRWRRCRRRRARPGSTRRPGRWCRARAARGRRSAARSTSSSRIGEVGLVLDEVPEAPVELDDLVRRPAPSGRRAATLSPVSSRISRAAASTWTRRARRSPPMLNQYVVSGFAGSQPCSSSTSPAALTGSTRAVVRVPDRTRLISRCRTPWRRSRGPRPRRPPARRRGCARSGRLPRPRSRRRACRSRPAPGPGRAAARRTASSLARESAMSRLRMVSWPIRSLGPKAAFSVRSIESLSGW